MGDYPTGEHGENIDHLASQVWFELTVPENEKGPGGRRVREFKESGPYIPGAIHQDVEIEGHSYNIGADVRISKIDYPTQGFSIYVNDFHFPRSYPEKNPEFLTKLQSAMAEMVLGLTKSLKERGINVVNIAVQGSLKRNDPIADIIKARFSPV
jgi:hypothetical protein